MIPPVVIAAGVYFFYFFLVLFPKYRKERAAEYRVIDEKFQRFLEPGERCFLLENGFVEPAARA